MAEYNFGNAFAQGWGAVQGFRDTRTRQQAGNALAGGDYAGARNAFATGGMTDEAMKVDAYDFDRRAAQTQQDSTERKERALWMKEAATALKRIPPERRREEFASHIVPVLKTMGIPDDALSQVTSLDDQTLDTFIAALGEDPAAPKGQWVENKRADGSSYREWLPDDPRLAASPAAAPQPPAPQTAATPAAPTDTDALFGALIMQESSGRPGVLGPQTQYGQAQGLTQMLPATAQEMAQKLGVPWRPELMTGTSEEAAAYQEQLGRAYFEEGLQRYGGDPRKALMYYHGGPNEGLWGPKTRAYADQVLARVQPYEVAAMGDTPRPNAPASPYAREGSAAPKAEWEQLSPEESKRYGVGNYQRNTRTGQVQQIAGSAPSSSAKPPTDGQRQTVAFAYRTIKANDRMNALADRGVFKPRTATAQLFDTDKNGVVRVITKTAEDRQFIQAAKEWLAPVLRKDTGAAVTDAELATYMDIFIPKYEDDYETLKQKANARFDTMTALLAQGGNLYDQTHGARPYEVKYPKAPKAKAKGAPGGGHAARQQRQTLDQIFGD